jgi:hypothetical protein
MMIFTLPSTPVKSMLKTEILLSLVLILVGVSLVSASQKRGNFDPYSPFKSQRSSTDASPNGGSNNNKKKSVDRKPVNIPPSLKKVGANIYHLGKAPLPSGTKYDGAQTIEKNNRKRSSNPDEVAPIQVSGYMYVHTDKYHPNKKKKGIVEERESNYPLESNSTNPLASFEKCFAPISPGVRWREVENYILDTSNTQDLSSSFILEAWTRANKAWDNACPGRLLMGSRDTGGAIDGADFVAPDGKNEIYFANIAEDGVLGLTILWGIFDENAPENARKIFEFDMIFNDADYTLGNAQQDRDVMDLQGLMTHELGHRHGAADIYDSECSGITMYGRTSYGKLTQRTIDPYSQEGICLLYGANPADFLPSNSNFVTINAQIISYCLMIIYVFIS